MHRHKTVTSPSTVWTPSVLASLGGNVALNAGQAITIDGSALSAANDLTLSGSSVSLLARENSLTQSMAHKEKSIGASIGLSPTSMVGQAANTGLAASQTSGKGSSTLTALNAMQGTAIIGTSILNGGEAVADNIVGVRQSIGSSSLHQSSTQTQTQAVGTTLNAGNTLSVVARGDNASDTQNGSLSAVASSLSGKDVVLAASKDITLQAGWNTTHSESAMKSKSTAFGLDIGVGAVGYSADPNISFSKQTQHVVTNSATAVNTTISGAQSVTIASPGSMTLNGATVTAPRIDLAAGSLTITSPQNTSDYRSTASQSGGQIGVGIGGSSLHQKVTDDFATTGPTLSGLYAGENGISVDVTGQTSLTAGVIDSTAEAAKNHFSTGSLVANSVTNVSQWKATQTGMSMSLGTDMLGSTMGILGAVGTNLASGASGLMGGGRSHDETSESQSAISGNITVNAGSVTGHYTTDMSKANAALDNAFDAKKLSNQLQAQRLGSQLAGEVGGLVADELDKSGIAGFGGKDLSNAWGRIALETAGAAAAAGVSGGNIGASAASTALSDAATITSRDWALGLAKGLSDDPAVQRIYANAISNAIASGTGAATGALVGGYGDSSINALSGAALGSAMQQFNQAEEEAVREVNRGRFNPNGRPLSLQDELRIAEYNNSAYALRKIDPDNPALSRSTLGVPTIADIAVLDDALAQAQEVNRLLTTPEGMQELIDQAPIGTISVDDLRPLAEEVAKNEAQEALEELDVGLYGEQARRSYNDGLTPDHIPSRAAITKYIEDQIGTELTPEQRRDLKNNTVTMMIGSDAHRTESRTFGGRNTKDQIDEDARDLDKAIANDFARYDSYFQRKNYTRDQVNDAITKVIKANKATVIRLLK